MFEVEPKLRRAISNDNVAKVKSFFIGVEESVRNAAIFTLTEVAAAKGSVKVLSMLLARGKDSPAKHIFGESALHLATSNGHIEATKLLLEFTDCKEHVKQQQVMRNAIASNNPDFVQELIDMGFPVDNTLLSWAMLEGNEKIIHALMDYGCDIRKEDILGRSPLDLAAKHEGLADKMLSWEDTLTDEDMVRLISGEAIALEVANFEC